MSTKHQTVLRQESLRVNEKNLPNDECRDWFVPGKVRILILFFEELAKTGKILKFAQFYRKYHLKIISKDPEVSKIPIKEFQHFIDEEIPFFGNKSDEEKTELANKLFGSDPQVEEFVEAFLEKEEAKIVQTKVDKDGNVVRVELYKDDHQNGHLNGHHNGHLNGHLDDSPTTDSGTASDTQETTHSQNGHLNGEIKSNALDSLFGWDKPKESVPEYSDSVDHVKHAQQDVHVQHVNHENIVLGKPLESEEARSPTFGYTTEVGENAAPNWLSEAYLKKHPQSGQIIASELSHENHASDSHTSSAVAEQAAKVAHEAEKVPTEEEEKAELAASQARLFQGLFSGIDVQETWNFSGTSNAEMIAEVDAIDQAINETTGSEEIKEEDVKALFNLERGIDGGNGRFLAPEPEPIPESKIDTNDLFSSFTSHFKQQEEAEAKVVVEEKEKSPEEEAEEKQKASFTSELKETLLKRGGEIHGENDTQTPINVNVVTNATGSDHQEREVVSKVTHEHEQEAAKVTKIDEVKVNSGEEVIEEVIEITPQNETQVKQLNVELQAENEASTSGVGASTTEAKPPKKVITLDELIRSLLFLYIKFIEAFDKIFETQPKAAENKDLAKFHEDFRGLVNQLLEITENHESGSPEHNRAILQTILEFYNGTAFRKIYTYLSSDESEFCKAIYSIMEKTRKTSGEIATEYKDDDAQKLSVLMKERVESIEQIGKDDQTRVKELLKNNATELANVQSNLQRLVTTLNVVIRQHSKNDYISAARIHLDNFDKMQINQPGKLILLRDRVVLICDPKKGKSETVFSSVLKDVKVQQVAKNRNKKNGNVFSRMFSCTKDPLVSDDELEDRAAKDLLQVTQRTDNYRNTFRLQITPGNGSFSGDAKQFLDKFEKMSEFPDFKDLLFELDEHFKSTAEA